MEVFLERTVELRLELEVWSRLILQLLVLPLILMSSPWVMEIGVGMRWKLSPNHRRPQTMTMHPCPAVEAGGSRGLISVTSPAKAGACERRLRWHPHPCCDGGRLSIAVVLWWRQAPRWLVRLPGYLAGSLTTAASLQLAVSSHSMSFAGARLTHQSNLLCVRNLPRL